MNTKEMLQNFREIRDEYDNLLSNKDVYGN